MFDYKQPYDVTCKEAQLLMIPVWVNDPGMTDKERQAFETHLLTCSACAQEYEETSEIISLIRKDWGPISEETRKLLEQAERPIQLQNQRLLSRRHRMTIDESWKDLLRRCPDLALSVKRRKRQRLLRQLSAAAACLVIGAFIWLAFSIYSKPEIAQESVLEQVAFSPKPSIKIELVSQNGNILIPTSHEIIAADELKTLLINNKHRMVMNTNTALSIEPLVENSRIGCMVTLGQGEIYTNVEQDGNPFIVSTAHGKAVITGTSFDIKATDTSTTLVVSEGTIQFESENGIVEVTACQISRIVAQSAPTNPIFCNAAELTTWATGYKVRTVLAKVQAVMDDYDLNDFWLTAISGAINLENIEYEVWIEENRDWFKREFPWIFQLQSALTKEGVKADYPELLISSGDIWQFAHQETSPQQIPILYFDPLLKTASMCGFDKRWLLENVPAAKLAINRPTALEGRFTGLEAFRA